MTALQKIDKLIQHIDEYKSQPDEIFDIFNESKMNHGTYYIDRVKYILRVYNTFIDNAKHRATNSQDIYDLITSCYYNKDIDLFVKDYDDFVSNIDKLNYFVAEQKNCKLQNCTFIGRAYRDVSLCSKNIQHRKTLYHSQDDEKRIVIIKMLDILHNVLYHTFEMGLRCKINKLNEIKSDNDECDLSKTIHAMKKEINVRKKYFMSIRPDMNNNKNNKKQTNINNKFVTNIMNDDRSDSMVSYSYGVRFYYHDYYKDNENEREVVPGTDLTEHGNKGYSLKDWYIPAKYKSFKDELLNNNIFILQLYQFNNTQQKAILKLNKFKQMKSNEYFENVTKIKKGSVITNKHIMSILFYTDWTELCTAFSTSYRKLSTSETDEELKKRHSEFAIWAKLLRETIECFGEYCSDSDIKSFYHGISIPMVFSSFSKIFGIPLSTTKTFSVALNFSQDGIILKFPNTKYILPFWNCISWSDYPTEDELLFVGGFDYLYISSIYHVPTTKDYTIYVQALRVFSVCIRANYTFVSPNKHMKAIIKNMLHFRLSLLSCPLSKRSNVKKVP
eukprot:466159_1